MNEQQEHEARQKFVVKDFGEFFRQSVEAVSEGKVAEIELHYDYDFNQIDVEVRREQYQAPANQSHTVSIEGTQPVEG